MTTDLRERLASLADDAPRRLPADGLWRRGRRRHRVRQALVGAAVVLATVGGVTALQGLPGENATAPVVQRDGEGHLPRHVYAPRDPSATVDPRMVGPLAVLDVHPFGVGSFGVSAEDGRAAFLDLPQLRGAQPTAFTALSPDGTKVAVSLAREEASDGVPDQLTGWGVFDTVSGTYTELRDPRAPLIEGMDVFEIAFTGDSRHLLTNYSRTTPATDRSDELVAWDVETGERLVMEGKGHYWLPNLGSAPRGVVWARGDTVFRIIPGGWLRDQRTVHLQGTVLGASWGPDDRAFAYLGTATVIPDDREPEGTLAPTHLFVGPDSSHLRRVDLPMELRKILGWRDATHVVVAYDHQKYAVVDVQTLEVERGSITGDLNFFSTKLASDLWANSLVDGVRPPDPDPFVLRPRLVVAGGVVAILAGLLLWKRRRGRA